MGFLSNFLGIDPEALERKGDTYFANESWGPAKIEYEKALDGLANGSPEEDQAAVRLRQKLHQSKEALADEHRQAGQNLQDQGFLDEARELFQLALDLTQDTKLTSTLEDILLEMANETAAEDEWKPPESEFDGPPAEETPSREEDDDYFEALCGTLPDEIQRAYISYGVSFKSGYLALNRGDFQRAADDLSRAMEQNSSPKSFVPLELAGAFLNLGRLEEARDLLQTFLHHHKDALPGYQLLCDVLWEMNASDEAEALAEDCPEELKNSLAYCLLRGETMVRAGKFSEAESFYRDFMQNFGWHESIAGTLADACERQGKLEPARDLYATILDRCSSCHRRVDPSIKRKLADIDFDLDQHTTATLEIYLSLAHEDPDNTPYYFDRVSRIYSSLGDEGEARRFRTFARQAERKKG